MRNQHRPIDILAIQNLNHMLAHDLQTIRLEVRRLVGIAITQQIGRNYTVSALLQECDLVSPVIAGRGVAVEEEEGGFSVRGGDVDVAVGGAVGESGFFGEVGVDGGCHFVYGRRW